MRQAALALLLALVARPVPGTANTIDPLEVSWDKIVQEAAREAKFIYLAFLGDGWSVASTRFSSNVLESQAFQEFASRKLLYCPVLARTSPPMSKERTAHLQALVIHFDMQAYPTFLILAPDGTELLRHGYKNLQGKEYVRLLESIIPEVTGEKPPPTTHILKQY